jgi:hypothetical protein
MQEIGLSPMKRALPDELQSNAQKQNKNEKI